MKDKHFTIESHLWWAIFSIPIFKWSPSVKINQIQTLTSRTAIVFKLWREQLKNFKHNNLCIIWKVIHPRAKGFYLLFIYFVESPFIHRWCKMQNITACWCVPQQSLQEENSVAPSKEPSAGVSQETFHQDLR